MNSHEIWMNDAVGRLFMEALQGVILLAMVVGILAAIYAIGWLLFWGVALCLALVCRGFDLLVAKINRS